MTLIVPKRLCHSRLIPAPKYEYSYAVPSSGQSARKLCPFWQHLKKRKFM
jgi:hypothetical protein